MNIDELVDNLVDQSNIYATQNGWEFETNYEEMLAFLGINYVMFISKLPTLKCYWITNDGIRNVITHDRFMEILKNIHFNNNYDADTTDRGYKIRPIMDHLTLSWGWKYFKINCEEMFFSFRFFFTFNIYLCYAFCEEME